MQPPAGQWTERESCRHLEPGRIQAQAGGERQAAIKSHEKEPRGNVHAGTTQKCYRFLDPWQDEPAWCSATSSSRAVGMRAPVAPA